MVRFEVFCLVAVALLQLAACDGTAPQVTDEIEYGEAKCSGCGAVIDDPHFAALLHLKDGQVRAFDDPGCLSRTLSEAGAASAVARFHDHQSDAWLSAEETWFAHTAEIESPQGYNWAAFASFGDAQDAVTSAAGTGEILPYAKATERLRTMRGAQG